MDIGNIIDLLQDNIDIVNTKEFIEKVLNMHNNLLCFDSLNRIIIQLQYDSAFDLKSFEEWEMCGRSVQNGSKQIWVVAPQYETKYVYSDNPDSEADIHDLSIVERNKAIELNIIKKKSDLKVIKTIPVYDIRQTKKVDSGFKVGKPILNQAEILRIFKELTGCNVKACDEFFYSTTENELFIPTTDYNTFANMIIKAMLKYFLEIIDTSNYSEEQQNRIEEYTKYSLITLLRSKDKVELTPCSDISALIQILSIVDSIVEKITSKIQYSGHMNTSQGAVQGIDIIKKAEVVLDIFTAVSANKKLGVV